jgi:hypothetical protein
VAGIAFISSITGGRGRYRQRQGGDRPYGYHLIAALGRVLTQVSQWSGAEDAWVITTVPLSALAPAGRRRQAAAPPGSPMANPMAGVMQQIQQIAGGVKFGSSVVGTAAIQADNAADATQLANTLQFLVNLMQMQAQQKNPQWPTWRKLLR